MLIEGPAGVGKTDLAISSAKALGFELLRLQCYEGLDATHALIVCNRILSRVPELAEAIMESRPPLVAARSASKTTARHDLA